MGLWDQQSEDLKRKREEWIKSQQFCFQKSLASSQTEEEVKAHYIRHFSFPANIRNYQDLRIGSILFEFKYSADFKGLDAASEVIAQALYYVRREARNSIQAESPKITHLVIADKDEAAIITIADFEIFYSSNSYDWEGCRPSSPDPKLVEAIRNSRLLESIRIFHLVNEDDLKVFENLIYSMMQISNHHPGCHKTEFTKQKFALDTFFIKIKSFILSYPVASKWTAILVILIVAASLAITSKTKDEDRQPSNSEAEVINIWEQ